MQSRKSDAAGSHEAVLYLYLLDVPLEWDDARAKPKVVHSKARMVVGGAVDHS